MCCFVLFGRVKFDFWGWQSFRDNYLSILGRSTSDFGPVGRGVAKPVIATEWSLIHLRGERGIATQIHNKDKKREGERKNGTDGARAGGVQRERPVEADLRGGEGADLRCHLREVVLRPRRILLHVRRQGRQPSLGQDEQERRRHLRLPPRPLRQGDRRPQRLGEEVRGQILRRRSSRLTHLSPFSHQY